MFNKEINTIWLDMDGVLADFDKRATELLGMPPHDFEKIYGEEVFWSRLNEDKYFFLNLDPIPDAFDLFDAIEHLPHQILTGITKHIDASSNQKIEWGYENFPGVKVNCCQASKKWTFCKEGDILIDDRIRYAKKWKNAGGIFICHQSAYFSIQTLKLKGII